MKKSLAGLAQLLIYATVLAANFTTSEAAKHVGENATVCGVVASVHTATSSKGSPTFVNLDKPYPNQLFTILIWGDDLRKFSPAPSSWDSKRVCVTGTITLFRGSAEMVAKDAGQVTFQK